MILIGRVGVLGIYEGVGITTEGSAGEERAHLHKIEEGVIAALASGERGVESNRAKVIVLMSGA